MIVFLQVAVEMKEEYAGGVGQLPAPGEVASRAKDILADTTRSDYDLPWMVREVTEVREES